MSPLPGIPWDTLTAYGLRHAEKQAFLVHHLNALTEYHFEACPAYRRIVESAFAADCHRRSGRVDDVPFFPVSLFKERDDLVSVPPQSVFKVLTSSGTTGQRVSRISLDAQTADLQARALVKIVQHYVGKQRLPMVVLDHPSVIRDRKLFSARGAGILGMMQFGRAPFYALRDDMTLDQAGLEGYLDANSGRAVLFFGFTFMVWQHVIRQLLESGAKLKAGNGILVHSGGWKKLESSKVSQSEFREAALNALGISRVVNFYGMVEQVGSVYFENPLGFLQAPVFSDVLIRDPHTLQLLPDGEVGLVQVVSILPRSYPGHSILTSDLGRVVGVDHPQADGFGRYFEVCGRAPQSEVRGCSDTYEQRGE